MARKRAKVDETGQYKIHFNVNYSDNVLYGETLDAALEQIENQKFYTKGVFIIEHDGKRTKSFALSIPSLRKLFSQGTTGKIQRSYFHKMYKTLA